MSKDINKIRIYSLIIGLVLFSLLAIGTVIDGDMDQEYMGFQSFRNHIHINRIIISNDRLLPEVNRNPELSQMVHEIDLSYYVFKDSSLFSILRAFNKSYRQSLDRLDLEWSNFTQAYFNPNDSTDSQFIESLNVLVQETQKVNEYIQEFEEVWRIFYSVIISLNILAFLTLLLFVFILSKDSQSLGSNTITSVRNALIEGQEKERLRISLELHDKVAQDLFACRMVINELSTESENETISSSYIKATSLLDSSIKEVRDLSYSLRPPALQAIGLDSAIQSYIDNFSRKINIPITFKAVGLNNKSINETISINLYRILQETLNNTSKHAHAQNIDVKLIYTYPYLLLKIEDDGVGFKYVKSEMKAKGRNQLGLPGIKERVSLLDGELIINSEKGEGTKILIKVPVVGNEKV